MQSLYRPDSQSDLLKMYVIDVLRYDIEQLDSILKLLNNDGCIGWRQFWPTDFSDKDVLPVLLELARDGLVDIYSSSDKEKYLLPSGPTGHVPDDFISSQDRYWYLLTPKGKSLWDVWDPPIIEEDIDP